MPPKSNEGIRVTGHDAHQTHSKNPKDHHKFGGLNSNHSLQKNNDQHKFGTTTTNPTHLSTKNEPHALNHPSWNSSNLCGPSDHAINYRGDGGAGHFGLGQNSGHDIQRRHSDTGSYHDQNQGQNSMENNVQQQQYDNNNADYYNQPTCCCADNPGGVGGGGYCPKDDSVICSRDPNCHFFKCKCISLDDYKDPFRPPKRIRPAWLGHCGKVLRFFAFYQESIPESMFENYRIHQVQIRYYLNDGTMEVFEPKTFDPGFPQGIIIGRGYMPMPEPAHNTKYSLEDLNVGCEITFYGKTFFITGVDEATRVHLNRKEGRQVLPNIVMPEDVYTNWRLDRAISQFPRRAKLCLEQEKRIKFLICGGKVLRFWAYWDSRCDYGGALRQYLFHYYLADDTVEIKEIVDPQGRTRGAVPFLSKGKLLKDHKDLVPIVGIREEALLILNTTGGGDNCVHATAPTFITDRLCPGIEEKEYITDQDLAIGAVINVYGRSFILVACDKATQTYYREKYGIKDFTPLVLDKSEEPEEYPKMEVPPHIGIGDEEDTLHNWDRIEPEPPRKLEIKAADNDILCFDARLHNPIHKVNTERRFVIKVFMVDNTMQIIEKPHPNTGFKQGQFLSRSKVRRRGSGLPPRFELGEESIYYAPPDYFIGNVLDVNGFFFLLTGAAEITLSYMEANPSVFPQSNFCLIIEKVKEAFGPLEGEYVVQMFSCNDSCLNGVMSMEDFKSILISFTKQSLNEHEIKTLSRGFRVDTPNGFVDWQTLQSVAQTELQRHGFDHFYLARVEYTLRYHDPCRFGHVDKETIRATLKGAKLPLDPLLVDFLVDHFSCVDDCCRINYCSLLHFLDWVQNPVPRASPAHISCVMKWLQPSPRNKNVTCVNYRAFLDLVNPNFQCSLPSVCCPQEQECCEASCCEEEDDDDQDEECCEQDNSCYVQYPVPEDENTYSCQRERAGRVISDLRVRSEELRCQDEDVGACCDNGWGVPWSNSTRLSEDLVDAYTPCEEDADCNFEMPGGEILNRGDFIGNEDLYTRPPPM